MRSWFLVALSAIACSAPPRRTGQTPRGELTLQQCRSLLIEDAPQGAPVATAPAAPVRTGPPPVVRAGEIVVGVGGSATAAAAIKDAIAEAMPRVRECYAAALDTMPGLEGKLTLVFRVDATGKVTSAEGRAGFHAGVTTCIEEIVRGLSVPASAGAVDATLPLVFRVPDADAPAPPPRAKAEPRPAPEATAATEAPAVFQGSTDAFAVNVVQPALEERRPAMLGCSRQRGEPVQLGFTLTVSVRSATVAAAEVDGLLDPAMELCIAGVLRDVPLAFAPPSPTGVRCDLILRQR
jgi:hypothetical protein